MTRSVAVIAAHPDDEVLLAGGAMARHVADGDRVAVLILATGLAARTDGGTPEADALARLRDEARAANGTLGVRDVTFADFPDNRMDSVALIEVVKRVEAFLAETAATVVYTHHPGDLNIDHGVVARAVLTAARPLPGSTVAEILAGEVLSSSEYAAPADRFRPNTYVEVTPWLAAKQAALAAYAGEVRDWPHPRSTDAVAHLARLRGAECGLPAAEAFTSLRRVRRLD